MANNEWSHNQRRRCNMIRACIGPSRIRRRVQAISELMLHTPVNIFNLNCEPKLCKVSGDGIRFKVRTLGPDTNAEFQLCGKFNPGTNILRVSLGPQSIICVENGHREKKQTPNIAFVNNFQEFWVSWFNDLIQIGLVGEEPFFKVTRKTCHLNDVIGYVKFQTLQTLWPVEWIYDESPVNLKSATIRQIEGGQLRWEPMSSGDQLPFDAMIGGFDEEPTYIIRAHHSNSLCPGRYVPSLKTSFVPWGGGAHPKKKFEILCGFNATWVSTKGGYIPENAFVAGTSEIRNEPLYIGRAFYEGYLINGKVHCLWTTCYLPYKGREVEVGTYEILVQPDRPPRGRNLDSRI